MLFFTIFVLCFISTGCSDIQSQSIESQISENVNLALNGWTVSPKNMMSNLSAKDIERCNNAFPQDSDIVPIVCLASHKWDKGINYAYLCLGSSVDTQDQITNQSVTYLWTINTIYEDLEKNCTWAQETPIDIDNIPFSADDVSISKPLKWDIPPICSNMQSIPNAFLEADVNLSPIVLLGTKGDDNPINRYLCISQNTEEDNELFIVDCQQQKKIPSKIINSNKIDMETLICIDIIENLPKNTSLPT